jgi:hypothetical protein
VREHEHEHASQWATIVSVAEKMACAGETLRNCPRLCASCRSLDSLTRVESTITDIRQP